MIDENKKTELLFSEYPWDSLLISFRSLWDCSQMRTGKNSTTEGRANVLQLSVLQFGLGRPGAAGSEISALSPA